MKIALVHDYIKEFGGAERVLRVLADMYPEAPIYTSFYVSGSDAARGFTDRKIIESVWAPLIKVWRLYSPLRFLLPWIWGSLDLSEFDLVITSCSNYIARGFKVGPKTKVVAYCHTPPRFLYGYKTGIDMQKYWWVRFYSVVVNHFLRQFDFNCAQRVDKWLVNSHNVGQRVAKFYRKDSEVIYPPIDVDKIAEVSVGIKKQDFFLIVTRIVGSKGLIEAAKAAKKLSFKLKIVGGGGQVGIEDLRKKLIKLGKGQIELLGRVSDEALWTLYAQAKGLIALARDEDFGITVVEAQAAGTPVIAFNGGGFKETVVDGKTGILIEGTDEKTIGAAMKRFAEIKWDKKTLQKQANRFSRAEFEKKFRKTIDNL